MVLLLIILCSISVLTTSIMMCLCWRKKNEKNDLLGLEGLVTQKNPDENVNHLPSAAIQNVPDGLVITPPDELAVDVIKRPIVTNNPRRSLPDIPFDGLRSYGDGVAYEPTGDNSSDLYATVEPYQNSSVKRHTLPNCIESRPSISQHSSLSQADDTFSPYARVKEHPYDKLCKTEHPYAQVQPSTSNTNQEPEEFNSGEGSTAATGLRKERATLQTIGETAPRSRRSSNQSVVNSDIPAASAVAGGIAASQELPYMTPPIAQTNFSGDSQDSSRGYTSITVREPLADIRAQTKLLNRRDLDPHYSTVSDDSDDVYTTIHDPSNSVYTSGSETYAQIQPPPPTVVEVTINEDSVHNQSSEDDNHEVSYERSSELPNVNNLKHVATTHSRQGSSSSSVGIVGSPKPEKRQANSPLPPPPPFPSFDFTHGNKSPVSKNLDDMYAKVHKPRKTSEKEVEEKNEPNGVPNNNDHNYETLRKVPLKQLQVSNGPDSLLSTDPGYEILKHQSSVVSDIDPNYEELQQQTANSGEVSNNDKSDFIYGYAVVNKVNKSNSIEQKSKNSSSGSETRDASSIDEPNYESMTSDTFSEPNYTLLKSTDSESDPNYESVKYLDVSYEQRENEHVQDEHQTSNLVLNNHIDPGYETIKGENGICKNIDDIVQV